MDTTNESSLFRENAVTKSPMTSVVVRVESTLTVPLMMPLLDTIDDPVMRREIAIEAVKLSVVERLGTFDGVEVHEEARTTAPSVEQKKGSRGRGGNAGSSAGPQYRAVVHFDDLCDCIQSLQSEYDRVTMVASQLDARLKALKSLCAGDSSDVNPVHSHLEEMCALCAEMMVRPVQTTSTSGGGGQMPQLVQPDDGEAEEQAAGRRRLLDASSNSDDDDKDDCSGPLDDPVAAGYTRLEDD